MSLASPMLDARLRDEGERMQRRLLGLFLALSVLTACGGGGGGGGDAGGSGGGGGGGGGGSPPPDAGSPAQGFWSGTTSTGYGVLGAVLENGEYWFMYYAGRVIQGLVHGSGSASNGNFALSDLKVSIAPRTEKDAKAQPVKLRHPRVTFEQKGLPIAAAIDEGGDLGIGIDADKAAGELFACRDVDRPGVVFGTLVPGLDQLFERRGTFHGDDDLATATPRQAD